jgi:general secretion pathway protein D
MYRIAIVTALIVCVAFAGCKRMEQAPADKAGAVPAGAGPGAGGYTAAEAEQQAAMAEAREYYLSGLRARQAGDMKAARDAFAKAAELYPNYVEALQALAEARAALGEAGPRVPGEPDIGMQKLLAQNQQIRRDVRELISQAKMLYGKEQFEVAIDNLQEALATMNWAAKLYNMDFGAERPEAEELLQRAQVQQQVFATALEAEQRKKAQQALEEELRKQADYRRQRAQQLLEGAREELAKKNFAEARGNVNRALVEEPGNAEAMELSDIIVEQQMNFERERVILMKDMAWRQSFEDINEMGVPQTGNDIVTFGEKKVWVANKERRVKYAEEEQTIFQPTVEQEELEKRLDELKLRVLNIDNQPFPEAVKTLVKLFKSVPILLHPDAFSKLSQVNVSIARNTETTLRTAIELLLARIPSDQGEFSYVVKDQAVIITTKGAEEAKVLAVYPVQDILRKIVNFTPPSIQIDRSALFQPAAQPGGGQPAGGGGQIQPSVDPTETGTADFRDMSPEGIEENGLKDLIINTVGGGQSYWSYASQSLGAPYTIDFRKGNMYISAPQPIHKEVQKILSHIRATDEVLVTLEVRFLRVEEKLLEEIGVDLQGFPSAVQQQQASAQGLTFSDTFLQGILNDADNIPSGLFFAKRGAGWGLSPTGTPVFLADGVPNGDAFGLANINVLDTDLSSALSSVPQGLRAGFSLNPGDSHINFVLNALESSSRSSTLAAPKITTYNLQPAYIAITKEQAFVGRVEVQQNTNAPPSVTVEPSILPSGIVLSVKPTVTWDRKYVILEVTAFSTTGTIPADKKKTIIVAPPGSYTTTYGWLVGYGAISAEFDFPTIDTENVKTTVIIPDGGTVILGGLSTMQRLQGGASVPLLGDVPILKFFFSRKGSSSARSSLVVLIHADITVVSDEERRFLEEG